MKKLGAFLLLAALAAAVWIGARYVAHRGEVRATIVFRDASGLRAGDPVVARDGEVGRVVEVARVNGQDAVTVRLVREHRRAIVSDSLLSIDRNRLVVTNTVAVGAPVDDGAILFAKEDRMSRWLAKHGGALEPYLDKLKRSTDEKLDALTADNLDRTLGEWKAKVPQWKKEGSASVDRRVAELEARVTALTHELEASQRADEARRVKERFDHWLSEIRK